jgi:hypothetical protein
LADWFKRSRVFLTDEQTPRVHPMSSTFNVDLLVRLQQTDSVTLSIGKYLPLADEIEVPRRVVRRFADALTQVQAKVFGHPVDWDVRHTELNDGRFVWMAYDDQIKKIRIGMGCYSEANDRQYGHHDYALALHQIGTYVAVHYSNPNLPIQFMGLPARWPRSLAPFLSGGQKQAFVGELLKLADQVWPG